MFRTHLVMHPLPDRKWEIQYPFVVDTAVCGRVIVPAGFVCDLNSIPRPFWVVAPPTDHPEAGVVHDYLYAIQAGREEADKAYLECLLFLGMSKWRARSRYWSLRAFGSGAYRSHAR